MKNAALLLVLSTLACSTANQPRKADPLLDMEQYLRRTVPLHLRYYVETSGAVQMLARGSMEWDADHVRIDVSGSLAGEQKAMRYDRPHDRRRDIVESWVRIGLGHNLFRIMNGREAETIDAQTVNVKFENGRYAFDIVVEGKRVGSAELWVDAAGLPLRRSQTVRFPQGEMKVTERYLWLP